jgi:spore maturation protein CgeB
VSDQPLSFVFLGLSITSSWGNGHATTYRGLLRELSALGHHVTFLERDVPWYRDNRDLVRPPYAETHLYGSLQELSERFAPAVRDADLVVVGSYVPEGKRVCSWVLDTARGGTAFYDIDTPVTLQALLAGRCEYLAPEHVPRFHLYLSFTGGPTLQTLEQRFSSPRARALYCSVDPELYRPAPGARRWRAGYLGTYSDDRQPGLERLLVEPARRLAQQRFVVAGPLYPPHIRWPDNVERTSHVAPADHAAFYGSQAFTVNVTRKDMIAAGYSPSVRLFEAAACGTPIITDAWEGIEAFFAPGQEILVARTTQQAIEYMKLDEADRAAIAERARARVLAQHTAAHRADTMQRYASEVLESMARPAGSPSILRRSGALAANRFR